MIYRDSSTHDISITQGTGDGSGWTPPYDTGIKITNAGGMIDAVYVLGRVYILFRTDDLSCNIFGTNCSGTVYIRVMSCIATGTASYNCTGPVTLYSYSWSNSFGAFSPNICPCSITYDGSRFLFALYNLYNDNHIEIWTGTLNNGVWIFGQSGPVTSSSVLETASTAGAQIRSIKPFGISVSSNYLVWAGSDNKVNILQSSDGNTWTNKVTLGETTYSTPAISYNPIELLFHIAWQGTDSDRLLNDITSPDAVKWGNKATFTTLSSGTNPSLAYHGTSYILILGWADNDLNGNFLNVIWQVNIGGSEGGCSSTKKATC